MQTYGQSVHKRKTFSDADLRAVCSQEENLLSSGHPGSLFSRGKPPIWTYGQSVLKGETSHLDFRAVCSQGETHLSSGLPGSLFSRVKPSLIRTPGSLFSRGKPLMQTSGQSVLKGNIFSRPDLRAVCLQEKKLLSCRLTGSLFSRGKPSLIKTYCSQWVNLATVLAGLD